MAGGSISQNMVPVQDVTGRWVSGPKEVRSPMEGKKAGLILGSDELLLKTFPILSTQNSVSIRHEINYVPPKHEFKS